MKISSRIHQMIAAPVDRVNEERRRLESQGIPMLNLGQAVPDFPPPAAVGQKLLELAGDLDIHRYTADPGLPELRAALAQMLRDRYQVRDARPDEIIVTAGANHAFLLVAATLLEESEQFCLLSPYFLNHMMAVQGCGGRIIEILPDENFNYSMPRVEQAIAAEPVRALVIVNPCNPSGKVFNKEELTALLTLCKKYGKWLICDEVYNEFVYAPAKMFSIGSLRLPGASAASITIGSFSKAFGMTGYRVGWLRAPEPLVSQLLKVQDYSIICPPHISQVLALTALTRAPGWPASHMDDLAGRKNELTAILKESGLFTIYEGDGTFFLWLRPNVEVDSQKEIFRLMEKAGVCTLPGYLFGENWRGWFRISYGTQPKAKLREAAARIIQYFSPKKK